SLLSVVARQSTGSTGLPPDPPPHPSSSALCLRLGLLRHTFLLHHSTVGPHHGYDLGPTWLLLLQVPPVVSLAPPSVWSSLVPPVSRLAPSSVISTLDSVHLPPPKFPTSSPSVVYVCLFLFLLWIYPCVHLLKNVYVYSCLLRASCNSA
ncbi:hypothetical protein M9458_002667, partial [Cirrhinus mrigala]